MSLSATLFGRDSAIFKATNILGLGIPGWLDKKFGAKDTEGPRLSDLSVQTSTYGAPIPRLYGTIAVMGNLIWLEKNKLKETVRKKKSGGKGGGGASEPTKTYSYSATFHIALCEGPIAGIRRIWCGDKLLYNAGSGDLETIIASNQAAVGWKLYLGTDSQLPDSRYEANVGVGNASAHRGMAYLAFYDFQLADYSNTLQGSQFKVEVVSQQTEAWANTLVGVAKNPWTAVAAFLSDSGSTYFTWRDYNQSEPNNRIYVNRIYASGVEQRISEFGIDAFSEFPNIALVGQTDVPCMCAVFGAGYQVYSDKGEVLRSGTAPGSVASACYSTDGESDFFCDVTDASGFYVIDGDSVASHVTTGATYSQIALSNDRIYCLRKTSGAQLSVNVDVFDKDTLAFIETHTGVFANNSARMYAEAGGTYYVTGETSVYECVAGVFSLFATNVASVSGVTGRVAFRIEGFSIYTFNFAATKRLELSYLTPTPVVVGLGSVIESECTLSGLITAADLDASLVTSGVRGYRVSGGSIRSALEPLQSAFPFDVRAHGYQIQFLPRGQASVATIPWEDLGASAGDTPDSIFPQSREMDTQLPAKTVVKYLDAAREYAIGEQFSERLNTEAVNKVERDLAIVLNADEAAGIAEMLNFLPWLERTPASFTLPPPYRYLEAGDVITVALQTATYEIRLNDVTETQDGRLECKAVPNRAALYSPNATGSEGVPPTGTIGLTGESLLVLLDIPVIDETLQNAPGFVGVMTGYSDSWPGGLAVRSIDDGQTWADLQAYSGKATIGTTQDILPASDCTLIDQRSLLVGVISGEFGSVTRDQMLAGINYAAYGVDGRWEIVRFQNADLQPSAAYLISGFVRGEKGTEWASGLHEAGDYFILLDDPDNAFIGMAVGTIAVPATYRGVTSGASVDDASDVPFTYQGVNLECLSPVYPGGVRDGSSNFTGTFTRRSRLSSSWWATGVVAPVGEASESYEIDVMDGATVVRTITAITPTFAYSAADQTTDFGSPQASIDFQIFQLSAVVGRGYPLEVTL